MKISELNPSLPNSSWRIEAKIVRTLPDYGQETNPRHILVTDGEEYIELVAFDNLIGRILSLIEVSLLSFDKKIIRVVFELYLKLNYSKTGQSI